MEQDLLNYILQGDTQSALMPDFKTQTINNITNKSGNVFDVLAENSNINTAPAKTGMNPVLSSLLFNVGKNMLDSKKQINIGGYPVNINKPVSERLRGGMSGFLGDMQGMQAANRQKSLLENLTGKKFDGNFMSASEFIEPLKLASQLKEDEARAKYYEEGGSRSALSSGIKDVIDLYAAQGLIDPDKLEILREDPNYISNTQFSSSVISKMLQPHLNTQNFTNDLTLQEIKTNDEKEIIDHKEGSPSVKAETDKKRDEIKRNKENQATEYYTKLRGIDEANEKAQNVKATAQQAIKLVSPYTTGLAGVAKEIPATQQRELRNRIETIKANLGLDQLINMKLNSPNGASGLGQVSVIEFESLRNSVANLDQLTNPDDLSRELNKVLTKYNNIMGRLSEDKEFYSQFYNQYKKEYEQSLQPQGGTQYINNNRPKGVSKSGNTGWSF
jgi:hypothetical protein